MPVPDIDDILEDLAKAATQYDADKIEALSRNLVDELTTRTRTDPEHSARALKLLAEANDPDRIRDVSRDLANNIRTDPTPRPDSFRNQLEQAVNEFNGQRVKELCERLKHRLRAEPDLYDEAMAKVLLNLLRRKRYFDEMIAIADVMLQVKIDTPSIRRLYAQALLDRGYTAMALFLLKDLKASCKRSRNQKEHDEAAGLIGRAYKQIYVDTENETGVPRNGRAKNRKFLKETLNKAIEAYAEVYNGNPDNSWHGVNAVALLARASRDGYRFGDNAPLDYRKVASSVVRKFERKSSKEGDWKPGESGSNKANKNPLNMWDCASAAEACLVDRRRHDDALDWTARYTSERYQCSADAFEYASTLRQFEEVWQLDPTDRYTGKILELLRAALGRTEGGQVDIKPGNSQRELATALVDDKKHFEAILGADRYKTLTWYLKGLDRATAVARIETKTGTALGTGFLLQASELSAGLREDWVLVTNAHVISDEESELTAGVGPRAQRPEDVEIVFHTGPNKGTRFRAKDILYTSGRHDYDCTIVTMTGSLTLDPPVDVSKHLPLVSSKQRVYVIGYPLAGGLAFSIDDNLLLDHDQLHIHYRAPTERGSSGSPVFNANWDLIAVHHRGGEEMQKLNNLSGTYPANEGIAIQKILSAARQALT